MALDLCEARKERLKKRRVDGVSAMLDFAKTGRLPSEQDGDDEGKLVRFDPAETERKRKKLIGTPLPNEVPVFIDRAAAGSSACDADGWCFSFIS